MNAYPSCVLFAIVPFFRSQTPIRDSQEDHLGEYGPTTYRYYRELGPTASDIRSVNAVNKKFTQVSGKPAPAASSRALLPLRTS